MLTASQLIKQFKLLSHPEGGWYWETYKSSEAIAANALPQRFTAPRAFSTAIYFLLEQGNFSAFHRIKSDECWHFYAGGPLEIYMIAATGEIDIITLGNDIEKGELFQFVVPANTWFASRPAADSPFCFVGCTVAPGFNFDDFELAKADELCNLYPRNKKIISLLCRQ